MSALVTGAARLLCASAWVTAGAGACMDGSRVSAPIRASSLPIVDGVPTSDYPAVVAITREHGTQTNICTGTLVAPTIVLTAKHCVGESFDAVGDPTEFAVLEGPSVNVPDRRHAVIEVRPAEGCWSPCQDASDIALLILAAASPTAPAEMSWDDPRSLESETASMVGYGLRPGGMYGTKYVTHQPITDYADGFIKTGPSTCQGDSGGPLLDPAGLVVGVTSHGSSGTTCGDYDASYNPIDRFRGFIENAFPAACEPIEETCNGIDDDCDGAVDETCEDGGTPCSGPECIPDAGTPAGLGVQCERGGECESGLCGTRFDRSFCTRGCDEAADCGTDFTCEALGTASGRVCVPSSVQPPPTDGGCTLARPRSSGPWAVLAVIALALGRSVTLRRRSRVLWRSRAKR